VLTSPHICQLRLLEIGDDVNLAWNGKEQRLARLNKVAYLNGAAGNRSGGGRINFGVRQIEFD
jgi:hypothetical protein